MDYTHSFVLYALFAFHNCSHYHAIQQIILWTDTLALVYIYISILFHYIYLMCISIFIFYALVVCHNSYVAMQ